MQADSIVQRHHPLDHAGGGSEAAPLSADAVAQAIEDLRTAIQLHDSCGGKEDLKRAERLQKKFDASQSND